MMAATTTTSKDNLTISSLVAELEKNRAALLAEMETSLTMSLSPIQSSLDVIRLTVESYGLRLTDIKKALSDHSDRLTPSKPRWLCAIIKDKMDDLRCNS